MSIYDERREAGRIREETSQRHKPIEKKGKSIAGMYRLPAVLFARLQL